MNRLLMRKRFLNILFKISVKSNFEKSPKWKLEGNNGEHYFDLIDARYRELLTAKKNDLNHKIFKVFNKEK